MYKLPTRWMQSCMFAAGVEGIVSWKQLYTARPNSGPGRDTVSRAATVFTVPWRLDLPTPVAWATLDPHPLQWRPPIAWPSELPAALRTATAAAITPKANLD